MIKPGWIFLNKPHGLSSTQASSKVRRLSGFKSAGHAGTLDPFATGVLPIALGETTKLLPYAPFDTKAYRFQVAWGVATSTYDCEGEISHTSTVRPTEEQIRAVLGEFVGRIFQIPPVYSAIKIQGQPAYQRVRRGEHVDIPKRVVQIDTLELISIDDENHATFHMDCHSGTYVRTLAVDLAQRLGTCAHVKILTRTRVGKIHLDNTISLEIMEKIGHKEDWTHLIKAPSFVLDDIPAITLTPQEAQKIRQGQEVTLAQSSSPTSVALYCEEQLIAMAEWVDQKVRPKRVFNW